MPRLKRLERGEGDPKAQEIMLRLEKNKSLLNIFRSMGNSPACLDAYLKFATALRDGKLDAPTREAVALAVAQVNGCEYALSAHTPLAKDAGLDEETIRSVRQGRAGNRRLNAAVALARKIAQSRGCVSDADVRTARSAGLDDGMIAEVVANVALNVFTNYFNMLNQTEIDHPHVSARMEEKVGV
jgi:AhpD family alkylhydroperoxidase